MGNTASNLDKYPFVDFDAALPEKGETRLYNYVNKYCLDSAPAIIQDINDFPPANRAISEAVEEELDQDDRLLRKILQLNAERVENYFRFSQKLRRCLRLLIVEICSFDPAVKSDYTAETVTKTLAPRRAFIKQFGLLLHFAVKFDEIKIFTPAVQNDWASFRRMKSSESGVNPSNGPTTSLNAHYNEVSYFITGRTPMISALADELQRQVCIGGHIVHKRVNRFLLALVIACRKMLHDPDLRAQFTDWHSYTLTLGIMTSVIILYDHYCPLGAFYVNSPINIGKCVLVIKHQRADIAEVLLNALRYMTLTLNSDTTPQDVSMYINTNDKLNLFIV